MSDSTITAGGQTNQPRAETLHPDNPYVGPLTFQPQQADRFFGREREASELLAVVSTERLTLFYAQSGAGKSSLINTRLIPGLQAKGFEVLPVGRVGGGDETSQGANPYVFNLMRWLLPQAINPSRFAALSLTDFLTRLVYDDGGYTLIDASPALNASLLNPADAPPIPRVLILDQFEEILTVHLSAWEKRAEFFDQLAAAMAADPYLWVVLTLREDYVAGLDPYAHRLPTGFRARYYMQRMGRAAALEAVQRPVAEIGKRPFAPGVAEELVDNLRLVQNIWSNTLEADLIQGEFVEPVQLQVVCFQLWQKLQMASGDKQPNDAALLPPYITETDLKGLAGIATFLHLLIKRWPIIMNRRCKRSC